MDLFNLEERQKIIFEHYTAPKNYGILTGKNSVSAQIFSSSCVDNFFLSLKIENKRIQAARFEGVGCAVSVASADIFASIIMQKPEAAVHKIYENYHLMLEHQLYDEVILKELTVFRNLYLQKNRIKCALIAVDGFFNLWKETIA